MNEDENYLEQEFPKGKTKFRGQAMVLIALSRVEGKLQEREKNWKIVSKYDFNHYTDKVECLKQIKEDKNELEPN